MIRIARAIIGVLLAFACVSGQAQFTSGQVLTASGLNAALAGPAITGGTINGAVIGGTNPKAASFTTLSVTSSLTATGLVTLPSLAAQAANTVIANASGSSASPSAFAMPSCSGTNNALRWTSGSGFACASSIALTSTGLSQFASTTSAQLASVISDETGTGSAVFGTSPAIATPAITGGTINNATIGATTPSTGAFTTLSATGNTTTGPVTTVGNTLYPTIVQPVSTTATTTNGSANITVTSATGIAVGMGVYGTFVSACNPQISAYVSAYVTAISGTTVTMSCPATATNSTATAVQFGQQRYSPTSTIIANDVGTQILKVGSAAQGNSASWLNQISTGQDYRLTSAAQIVTPPGGGYALTLASRTSDATGGAVAFPLQALFYADSGNPAGSEAEYLQSNLASATAGKTLHIQFEQSIVSNWGSPTAEDPYSINLTNQTITHRLDCGNGTSSPVASNCTTAIDIVPNPQTFQNGVVISNGALDTGGGAHTANALSMPLMNQVVWYSAASTFSSAIYSPSAGVLDFSVPSSGAYNFLVNGVPSASINSGGQFVSSGGGFSGGPGAFTTVSASGLITPASAIGIKGTTAADNAQAGSDGEYVNSSFSAVALTNNTLANATSISLTAGDWDVTGHAMFVGANTTAMTYVVAGASTTSATLPGTGLYCQQTATWPTNGAVADCTVPTQRINVSAPTTVYLPVEAGFTASTLSVTGFLRARRIR